MTRSEPAPAGGAEDREVRSAPLSPSIPKNVPILDLVQLASTDPRVKGLERRAVVTIFADGKIEFAKEYPIEESCRAFWERLAALNPWAAENEGLRARVRELEESLQRQVGE